MINLIFLVAFIVFAAFGYKQVQINKALIEKVQILEERAILRRQP